MFADIFSLIKSHDIITIFGHVNPDGDCYGSQVALRDSLRLAFPEKKIYAIGSGCPKFFVELGELDIVSNRAIKNSLAIIVDANDLSRMEDKRASSAKAFAKIDHHVDVGSFTLGPSVVLDKACSATQIIFQMLEECHLPINKTVAQALFLGMLTDTGRFQFINDFPEAFSLAAKLCKLGADPSRLNRLLNATTENSLLFKGFVYTHFQKTNAGMVYLTINQNDLSTFHLTAGQVGSMVNLIGNIKGYPVWAFFSENPDGTCHAEFRSNGPSVQPIALKYGGGGHLLAAGATLERYDMTVINDVLNDLDKAIINYQKEAI